MALKSLREGASSGFLKIILFGFLVLAVGGLVLTDVGGFFRDGVTSTDVAKVGDQTISAPEFDRIVRQRLYNMNIAPQDAYQYGIINNIAAQEIRSRLLLAVAREKGLSIPRDIMARRLADMVEPLMTQAAEGQTKQDMLEQLLRAQGYTEAGFIAALEREIVSNIVQDSLMNGGKVLPDNLAADLYAAENEQRDFNVVLFEDSAITISETPDDEALLSLYETTKSRYTIPERRSFTILSLNLELDDKDLNVSAEEIQSYYQDNIETYKVPERRTLEQAIVSSKDEAGQIIDQAQGGKTIQQAALAVTGNDSHYVPESEFAKDGMIAALRDDVFGAQIGAILAPVETPLGWHVVRVTAVKEPYTQGLEQVKSEIEKELVTIKSEDLKYERIVSFDDYLLDEASFDAIAEVLPVSSQKYAGLTAQNTDTVLAGFPGAAQEKIANSLMQMDQGLQSQLLELDNGDVIALRVDEVVPESYKPLADIREDVAANWMKRQQREQNRARAASLVDPLKNGEVGLNAVAAQNNTGLTSFEGIARNAQPPAPLNIQSLQAVFETEKDGFGIFETAGGVAVFKVTDIVFPSPSSDELADFKQKIAGEYQQAHAVSYLEKVNQKIKPEINQPLLDRMYGPGSGSF